MIYRKKILIDTLTAFASGREFSYWLCSHFIKVLKNFKTLNGAEKFGPGANAVSVYENFSEHNESVSTLVVSYSNPGLSI